MTSINPINVNTQGVGSSYGYGVPPKTTEEAKEETTQNAVPSEKQVSPDAVLTYMAQSAAVVPTKALDPSKYVDDESAARIAGFMSDFEGIVATNLSAIAEEFPGMSDSAKMTLALANVNSTM